MNEMEKDSIGVWNRCLNYIKDNVTEQSFKTWFTPIRPKKLVEDTLTIQVPNKFFYEWLEEHYLDVLKTAIFQELGENARLEYHVLVNKNEEDLDLHNDLGAQIKNPFVIPGIRRIHVDPNLNTKYTLDSLIEGDCNRLAKSAGLAIARKPGETAFNPLVIYGNVGLGKTHIAQAIGNEIVNNHPKKKVLYISSEKFTNQIIKSIRDNSIDEIINFYQMLDVLIIDDIQFLANKTKTQEIFFHIFNQLHQNKKQLVITSDRPPRDLEGMEERLISRFKWGLTADLQIPDFETRMAILGQKLEDEKIAMPYNVQEYICYNVTNNVRELEGVLISVIAQARLNKKELDIDLARNVVSKFITEMNRELNIDNIIELTSNHYKIDADKLKGKTRKREVVLARQMIMFLSKKHTQCSLKEIGQALGGRDHSTVIYSCNALQDMLDIDDKVKKDYESLSKKLMLTLQAIN